MNKNKRNKNRLNAAVLSDNARRIEESNSVCPNCAMKGEYHWVSMPTSLEDMLNNRSNGFWICPKMYGSDGKRIDVVKDNPFPSVEELISLLP